MPKVSPIQTSFSAGEISPLLYGRVDADRYRQALKKCLNYMPTVQGGLPRRSGSYYVAPVKTESKSTRLIPFEFSVTQAYMLEFGDQYIRFFKDNAPITLTAVNITNITQANPAVVTAASHGFSNGDRVIITGVLGMVEVNNREFIVANVAANTFELQTTLAVNVNSSGYTAYSSGGTAAEIYEISSPYVEADLFQIKYTQSVDVLYLVHPTYAPRKLSRTAHTSWTLTTIDFLDGPYLTQNSTATTLTPSAATGAGVTLTASSATGINNNQGFLATDVGRLIRLLESGTWGYCKITAFTSSTVVTVTVIKTLGNTNSKTDWRLGAWSGTTGYPGAVTFHEDRLFFGGPRDFPQRIDGSRSSDYENFAPTDTDSDATIEASHAVSFSLNSNDVNVVRWLSSDEKGLLVGTVGGEWNVRPSSQSEALSPTNITAKPATTFGSANIQPVRIGKAVLFVQRAGRKLREMTYFYEVDGFRCPDMTELSEHITESGVIQIAHQKEPQPTVWCVRDDGVLLSLTYERDSETLRVGWARHILGGTSDAADSNTEVESVAVIPAVGATHDDVWIICKRYINGATHRYIEYLKRVFKDEDDQQDAFLVDAGLTYDAPITVSGATQANPIVITANNHGFSNGDKVLFNEVMGMTDLNGNTYLVANKTTHTFELTTLTAVPINSTGFSPYVSGGEVRKLVTMISGLFHLEGESVSILGDGAVQPNVTVTNGKITITELAAVVQIGYSYMSDGQMLRLEAGAADGTALGKTRRTHRVGMLLHRTLGLKIGYGFDDLDSVIFRTTADDLTRAVPLFSGIQSETVQSDYDFENEFCFRQDQPLPGMILAIMPQMVTQDRG